MASPLIAVKDNRSDLKTQLGKIVYSDAAYQHPVSRVRLSDVLDFWVHELPKNPTNIKGNFDFIKKLTDDGKAPVVVTHIIRRVEPTYRTVLDAANDLRDDPRFIPKFGSVADAAKLVGNMLNRSNLNENEWIYRRVLFGLLDPNQSLDAWLSDERRYTTHFFGRGIDLRTNSLYTPQQSTLIQNGLRAQFGSDVRVLYHKVPDGAEHIHININGDADTIQRENCKVNVANGYPGNKNCDTGDVRSRELSRFTGVRDESAENAPEHIQTTDQIEVETHDPTGNELEERVAGGDRLPVDIDIDTGLMDVLRIGDLDFIVSPVSQISFDQSNQTTRFSTLRTKGDPKIVTDTVPSQITVNIVFPNRQAVDQDLRKLIGQFIMTPITIVESRFIARALRPHLVDHLERSSKVDFEANPDAERMWMILNSINVHSVPGFPDTYEAILVMDYFEDRVFGSEMGMLVDESDLAGKYLRDTYTKGSSLVLPSERRMIQTFSNFKESKVRFTKDPRNSSLYKNYYRSIIEGLGTKVDPTEKYVLRKYQPDEEGVLTVDFLDFELDRTKLKEIEDAQNDIFYGALASIKQFISTDPDIRVFFEDKTGVVFPTTLEEAEFKLAGSVLVGTKRHITDVFRTSPTFRSLRKLFKTNDDIARKFATRLQESRLALDGALTSLNVDKSAFDVAFDILNASAQTGANLEQFANIVVGATNKVVNGLTGSGISTFNDIPELASKENLNTFIGQLLFKIRRYIKNTDTPEAVQVKVQNIMEAWKLMVNKLLDLETNDTKESSELAQRFATAHRFYTDLATGKRSNLMLADGKESILTGVSLQMDNKVVALPVIGWDKPTFQHLGRSDWSITLNFVVKGEDYIKDLMYAVNKTAHLSKQIQKNAPWQLSSLDTRLKIVNGGGILKSLSVDKMVLNSVNVANVQENPNWFNVSLNLEQANMNIKNGVEGENLESFRPIPTDARLDAAANALVPVFKAISLDPDTKGRLLDYRHIQATFGTKSPLWETLGMEFYDYMDRYYVMKLFMFDSLRIGFVPGDKLFPTVDISSYKERIWKPIQMKEDIAARVVRLMREDPGEFGTTLKIGPALKKVAEFFQNERNNGVVFMPTDPTRKLDHPGLLIELENHHNKIIRVVGGHFELISSLVLDQAKESLANIRSGTGIRRRTPPAILTKDPLIIWLDAIKALRDGRDLGFTDQARFALLSFGSVTTSRNLSELIKNLSMDEESLSLIPDLEILPPAGELDPLALDQQGPPVPLNLKSFLRQLRTDLEDRIGGCYPDFDIDAIPLDEVNIPKHIVDPSFYIYSQDMITPDLVRENIGDLTRRYNFLEQRRYLMAQNAVQAVEEYQTSGRKLSKPVSDGLITERDIEYIKNIRNEMTRNMDGFLTEGTNESFERLANIINGGFEEDKFNREVQERVHADQSLVRLTYIYEVLKWEILQSELVDKANQVALSTSPNNKDESGTASEYTRRFMETGPLNQASYYQLALKHGGIYIPITDEQGNERTVAQLFEENELGKDVKIDVAMPGDFINAVDRISRMRATYKRFSRQQDASTHALINAGLMDPGYIARRIDDMGNLVDMMWKGAIVDQAKTARIFPTFKLYFIEEDAPEWGIYHDFYDYSAVQEINIVKDKEHATDVCTVRLSNIAGKLTDSFSSYIPEQPDGTNLPMNSTMLKSGTSMLIKMGYSNNQVDLPVAFYGRIVEVNAGPIVELVAQSYGAELTHIVGDGQPINHNATGDVKGLGDVVTWILQNVQGLNHFGKLGFDSFTESDLLRQSGTILTGLQGRSKIASYFTGIKNIKINDPRDDNIFLPYNTANVNFTELEDTNIFTDIASTLKIKFANPGFDWVIFNKSAWEAIEEVTWFQPDMIKTVLPFNDNLFPVVPRIRQTLYVGPRSGYYKYTDAFKLQASANNKEVIQRAVADFEAIAEDALQFVPSNIVNGATQLAAVLDPTTGPVNLSDDNLSINRFREAADNIDFNGTDPRIDIFNRLDRFFSLDQNKSIIGGALGISLADLDTLPIAPANFRNDRMEMLGHALDTYIQQYVIFKRRPKDRTGETFVDVALKRLQNDTGVTSLKYNKEGGNFQYKKVQTHHIATAHSNILNNNIIATAEGWSNRIRMLYPDEPQDALDGSFTKPSDIDALSVTEMSLDDDIFDDAIRTKQIIVPNIDPNEFDDALYSRYVSELSAPYQGDNPNKRRLVNEVNPRTRSASISNELQGETGTTLAPADRTSVAGVSPQVVATEIANALVVDGVTSADSPQKEEKDLAKYKEQRSKRWTSENAWRFMPARYRVAVSILAKEAAKMYDGELTIIGDPTIKPYDIIHMFDAINDMEGPFEVGRVIHTFNTQTGFTTRIRPNLIVQQKNKFSNEEIYYVNKMQSHIRESHGWRVLGGSTASGLLKGVTWGLGAAFVGKGAETIFKSGILHSVGSKVAAFAGPLGIFMGALGIALGAYNSIRFHNRLAIAVMGNIIGRDSLDLLPITYKGVPYMAGVDGYRKNGPMYHMYSQILQPDGKLNIFERLAYSTAPFEAEWYIKYLGNSDGAALLKTMFATQFRSGNQEVGANLGAGLFDAMKRNFSK